MGWAPRGRQKAAASASSDPPEKEKSSGQGFEKKVFILLGVFGESDAELWSHAWCPTFSQPWRKGCPRRAVPRFKPSRRAGFGFVVALMRFCLEGGALGRSSLLVLPEIKTFRCLSKW